MKEKKINLIIVLGAAVLFAVLFYFKIPKLVVSDNKVSARQNQENPFNDFILEARSAMVFDLVKNGPIYEFNSQAQLPLASLTKIMTVLVAEEIKTKDISQLVEEALVQSSNQAASALASMNGNFIDLMNKKAKEIGMNQTYFLNETGLDISAKLSGAYGSASDIVKLVAYALKSNPDFFSATVNNFDFNTNPYASTTTMIIGSKTGLTDLAGGNLAIIFDAGFNHPVVSVVLGSTENGRFIDTQKLIEATYKYLEK